MKRSLYLIVLAIGIIACKKVQDSDRDPVPNVKSVAEWEKLFVGAWDDEFVTADKQSKSMDSHDFYNLGYSIDANTTMFQATGNVKYLDRALYYINNVIKNARLSSSISTSQFKDQYSAWVSNEEGKGDEYPLYESFCWRYVTTLLRIMKNSPSLLANSTYNERYNAILEFTEKNIFNKWYSRNANGYIYRSNTHMASHWMRISMDLWNVTQNDAYRQVFNNINYDLPNYTSSLRGQLKPNEQHPEAYSWQQNWGQPTSPVQDVPHGNAVIGAIVEAHDNCEEYKDKDIRALINTFNLIWPSQTKYAEFVDGSGTGNGWFNDGFVKLGRYDASIQKKLENHGIGENTQLFGNGALNAKILLDGKPVYPTNLCSTSIYKIPN